MFLLALGDLFILVLTVVHTPRGDSGIAHQRLNGAVGSNVEIIAGPYSFVPSLTTPSGSLCAHHRFLSTPEVIGPLRSRRRRAGPTAAGHNLDSIII